MRIAALLCLPLLWLSVACTLVLDRAYAQEGPRISLAVPSTSATGPMITTKDPALRLTKPDPEYWSALRARLLMGVGTGLMVGAATHFVYAAPAHRCGDERPMNASLYGAAGVGAIGFSLTLSGGLLYGLIGREHRPQATRGQVIAATALALGGALVPQALLAIVMGFDGVRCSS